MSAHKPVMLTEMLTALAPCDDGIYVDGTFGAGGYSRAILAAAHCTVYALDQDPNVKPLAEALAGEFPGRFIFVAGNFSDMGALLAAHHVASVDGIVLDIGVSSMQLDESARGFSFRNDGPLDMRMSASGMSAMDVVNGMEEEALANIIYQYGEEKASRRIAHAIVEARSLAPITRTKQLAEIVASVLPRHSATDPATRTFQALRIHVNDELGMLSKGLAEAERLLVAKGHLVVVTFHSLEDRIVKQFLHSRCGKFAGASRHVPFMVRDAVLPSFSPLKPEKQRASSAETKVNPRARSAILRAASRTEHAAHTQGGVA